MNKVNNIREIKNTEEGLEKNFYSERMIFTLTFILVLYTLKDFLIGLLPANTFPVTDYIIDVMLVAFLINLYIYSFNFLTSDYKFKQGFIFRVLMSLADFCWTYAVLIPLILAGLLFMGFTYSKIILLLPLVKSLFLELIYLLAIITYMILTVVYALRISNKRKDKSGLFIISSLNRLITLSLIESKNGSNREKYRHLCNIIKFQINKILIIRYGPLIFNREFEDFGESLEVLVNKRVISKDLYGQIVWVLSKSRISSIKLDEEIKTEEIDELKRIIQRLENCLRDIRLHRVFKKSSPQ